MSLSTRWSSREKIKFPFTLRSSYQQLLTWCDEWTKHIIYTISISFSIIIMTRNFSWQAVNIMDRPGSRQRLRKKMERPSQLFHIKNAQPHIRDDVKCENSILKSLIDYHYYITSTSNVQHWARCQDRVNGYFESAEVVSTIQQKICTMEYKNNNRKRSNVNEFNAFSYFS